MTIIIDGDANNNLTISEKSLPVTCPGTSTNDITIIAPGAAQINCSVPRQAIAVAYNGGAWQYQHNGILNQNQDCDAGCVAYAALDLYSGTPGNYTLVQGDGQGATTNGDSTALATLNPIAVANPATGQLQDANNFAASPLTITLDHNVNGGNATLTTTEANINHLNSTEIDFQPIQPSGNVAHFGVNTFFNGNVQSGRAVLPVGTSSGRGHLSWGVNLNIAKQGPAGTGSLSIYAPVPPSARSHAGPGSIPVAVQ